jgi:hypothetical protein
MNRIIAFVAAFTALVAAATAFFQAVGFAMDAAVKLVTLFV